VRQDFRRPALTVMADVNKPKHLARSASIFMIAPFVGGCIALIGGGALYGLRAAFVCGCVVGPGGIATVAPGIPDGGAPGLVAAIAMLLVRDARTPTPADNAKKGFGELLAFLRTHVRFQCELHIDNGDDGHPVECERLLDARRC